MWKPVLRALPRRSVSTRATACHDMQVLTLAASHARAARSTGDDAASDAPDASAAPITPCVVSALRMRPQLAFEGGRSGSVAADEASALRAAAVMADVAAAQKSIFGVVQGNNLRSGRKVLRSNLRGAAIKSWYPTDVMSLVRGRNSKRMARRAAFGGTRL
ncbi:hypothetical protein EON67_01155 [archaeon]|nr:MAG: hypothetical protein EON67_01155 [archaeon]